MLFFPHPQNYPIVQVQKENIRLHKRLTNGLQRKFARLGA